MSPTIKRGALLIGGLALSVSIGLNVRTYLERSKPRPAPGLAPGAAVTPFSAKNVADGRIETVAFDASRPTALYVFASTCPWCTRNADSIRALARQGQDKYHFVGISLSDGADGGAGTGSGLPFPVYAGLGLETRKAYKLGPIPQMILVSPDGRVLKTFTGAFVGPVEREIEKYFDVQLPAIPDAPVS